jgi:hypothetical protein
MKLIRFYHGRVLRAVARSTPAFDGFHSEENMAIESSPRIVSTTVLGLGLR